MEQVDHVARFERWRVHGELGEKIERLEYVKGTYMEMLDCCETERALAEIEAEITTEARRKELQAMIEVKQKIKDEVGLMLQGNPPREPRRRRRRR